GRVGLSMWDERIDEAAHGETIGAPGADFKARVLARIDQGLPSRSTEDPALPGFIDRAYARRFNGRWKLTAAALATAAILVMAFVIDRGNREIGPATRNVALSARGDLPLAPDRTAPMPSVGADGS